MIDHQLPKDWKDLQEKVAEILRDIGFETETDKKLKTVRGAVNVDVFSVDVTQSPNIVYVCECKHWDSNVPKAVVHSFRTVVQDFGAHYGIVISKKGFQKGAFEAARNTNIRLVSWFDFQEIFESKWLLAFPRKIYDECELLVTYTEPIIGTSLVKKLDRIETDRERRIEKFKMLRQKYMGVGFAILSYGLEILQKLRKHKTDFPIVFKVPTDKDDEFKTMKFYSYREFFNELLSLGRKGLNEFSEVLDEPY